VSVIQRTDPAWLGRAEREGVWGPPDKREQAREHLTTATTMYRGMGMTYWLEKVEAETTDLGR
jgi:hypothetical protein